MLGCKGGHCLRLPKINYLSGALQSIQAPLSSLSLQLATTKAGLLVTFRQGMVNKTPPSYELAAKHAFSSS